MNRSYWPIMGHKGMYIMFYICCQWIDHIDPLWDIRVCTSCFTFVVSQSIILTHYGIMYIMFYICCQSIDHIDPLWDIRVCTSCFTFVVNESIILTHYGIQGYVHHVLHLLSINRSYWPIMGYKGMYIMFYICCQCRSYWPIMGHRVCTFVVNQSIILTHYGT